MADYVVIVDATSQTVSSKDDDNVWPKVIKVPPPALQRGINEPNNRFNDEQRETHPEKWMAENVLPKYPGCRVSLFRSQAIYEPATHSKRGE